MKYKAYALMAIMLASVAAVGTAYAQTTPATVKTDKTNYAAGDQVKVTGNIGQTVSSGQPALIKVTGPTGNIVRLDQITPGADGSYTYTFGAGGVMKQSGTYKVQISYGGADNASTTFGFTASGQTNGGGGNNTGWSTAKLVITANDGTKATHDIKYKITGGTLKNMTGNQAETTLTAMITATGDGQLTLQLPRNIIDSKNGTDDSDFVVFVDQVEDVADDDMGATTRTVTINFTEGAEQIDIVGTSMVPEFGSIAAIVLAVAIVGIIVATTRYSKFSFFPKM